MDDERAVAQVLARYVRAVDHRDGAVMSALFVADAVAESYYNNGGKREKLAEITGAEAIGKAVAGLMAPHPPRGWSHHTTHDHIIEVDGDEATLDAQFVVFNIQGHERPAEGWPAGAFGAQGTIIPIESGYYQPRMRRVDGVWRIFHHTILLDQPLVLPGG
ncbi:MULTISPECIES: nuclear transport factor 2 family protein [unclassified Streptomyces]|uniref:nuclear transport factor 2 family protein n=1 Tax=unclassified Streptomyces TaxID=2593676 RepID=UPI002DD9FAE3|nr:nuclear transport factor 2 family protein [Streptomyces sp. NBC_00243]WRZ21030.1 nuclear transport factor 2 family protein [Streptomyces sp. NBC_00243]